jgi:hypothetical protein
VVTPSFGGKTEQARNRKLAENLAILSGRTFLLGVGAQKAGTTWLAYYLRSHPQVFMSPIKEMHFFGTRDTTDKWPVSMFRKKMAQREALIAEDEDAPNKMFVALRERIRMEGDVTRYRRFFRKRVTDERVFGEITPAYSRLDTSELAFVLEHFPTTKVIFLLRNPTDRLWSQMRFSEKFETLEELEAKIDSVYDRPVYFERYDYVKTIRNLRAVFPPDRLHLEFYERLFTPEAVEGICKFLEIAPHPAKFKRSRNVSVKMPLSPLIRPRIIEKLAPQYRFVRDIFAGDLPDSWQADLKTLS